MKSLCFCWISAASFQVFVTSRKPALLSLHSSVSLTGAAATFTHHPSPLQISRASAQSRFISTLNTRKQQPTCELLQSFHTLTDFPFEVGSRAPNILQVFFPKYGSRSPPIRGTSNSCRRNPPLPRECFMNEA